MSKEWVDIVDTAVKIGLGALITGVFTYIGIKFSHKSERSKFMLEHKAKLLEQVAKDVEEYFSSWDYFNSIVEGTAIGLERDGIEDRKLTVSDQEQIGKRDKDLVESWPKRESAISKLKLMKATEASEALVSTRSLEKELRDRIIIEKEILKSNEVREYRNDVRDTMNNVHKALADFYATFQT